LLNEHWKLFRILQQNNQNCLQGLLNCDNI
jgi:hypothetical protein